MPYNSFVFVDITIPKGLYLISNEELKDKNGFTI